MLDPSDANALGIHHDVNVLEIMTNEGVAEQLLCISKKYGYSYRCCR